MDKNISTYNLKAVTLETGLSPATLRAWERRYGLLTPKRSSGGHRLYSAEDIKLLKWLVARQKEGLSISRAIDLWHSQSNVNQLPDQSPTHPAMSPVMLDQLQHNWVQACLAFNEPQAELIVARALTIATPAMVCSQLLQKGLAQLGHGWYSGTVTVQQEHFASALVARHLHTLFALLPEPTRPQRLLAACPPGENHDLSLLMLTFFARWHGWEVIYLGPDVPLEQLDAALQATSPQLVLSVAQTLPAAASLLQMAKFLKERSIPLAYGGGIFNQVSKLSDRIPAHFLASAIDTAPHLIEQLLAERPALPPVMSPSPALANALAGFKNNEAIFFMQVSQRMRTSQIPSRLIEMANHNFARSMIAALTLGDINFLDFTTTWLTGLLENNSVSPEFLSQYDQAVNQAIQEQSNDWAAPLIQWLDKFSPVNHQELFRESVTK